MNPEVETLHRGPSAPGKARFFALMGEFFASPAVRRELGLAMSDGPRHHWLVLGAGAGAEAGVWAFGALVLRREGVAELAHAVVLPAYRGRGLHRRLVEGRLAMARELGARVARATCNELSRPHLEAAGFVRVGARGRYHRMERAL